MSSPSPVPFPLLRRFLIRFVGTSLLATLGVFVAIELSISGGFRTILLPNGANPESPRDQAILSEFHLDDPVIVRHAYWVMDAAQGDLGRSIRGGTPVTEIISHRLTISLQLALTAMALAMLVGVPLGLLAAAIDGSRRGRVLTSVLSVSQSVPVFMSATILIWVFAVQLGWVRSAGWTRLTESVSGNLGGLILPAVAIAVAEIGVIARVTRAGVVAVLQEDFAAAAMAKGLSRRYILFRHALRPGSLALLNILGLNISAMIAGAFVAEIVFGIGGLGPELIEASTGRDLPLLLGLTLYTAWIYVVLTALVELAMRWADPRIRAG